VPFVTVFGLIEMVQVGSGTGGGAAEAVIAVTHVLVPPVFVTERIYWVVVFEGGITDCVPEIPTGIAPGFKIPVLVPLILQERMLADPFCTDDGLLEMVQVGGGVGIIFTGAAVT
jgi:hypothetical protein